MTFLAFAATAVGGFVIGYAWCWLRYAPLTESERDAYLEDYRSEL